MTILRATMITLMLALSASAAPILLSGTADLTIFGSDTFVSVNLSGPDLSITATVANDPDFRLFAADIVRGRIFLEAWTYGGPPLGEVTGLVAADNFTLELGLLNPGCGNNCTGSLIVCDYFGMTCGPGDPVEATISVATYLVSETTIGNDTHYVYSSIAQPAPEPVLWPVVLPLLGFTFLVGQFRRARARRDF